MCYLSVQNEESKRGAVVVSNHELKSLRSRLEATLDWLWVSLAEAIPE